MDLQMPQMGGIDAIIAIRDRWPDAKVIVLTTYVGDVLAQRALQAGARAYVLKVLVRKELLDTIRAVHAGSKRVHPEVAADIANHVDSDVLSHREIDVLTAIATGKSNKTVASTLGIGEETVKMHVKAILAKLGANDRTHAVTLALKRGIIHL
jgi:DNA-binding NarL/FixJ family response regulator